MLIALAPAHVAREHDDDDGQRRQHVEGDGDRLAEALGPEGHLVGEDGQHLGGPAGPALGEDVDDGEVVEGPDRREQHHDDQMLRSPGRVTWTEALDGVGAVDRRRLVELGRNRLQPGQERDAEEREPPPDVDEDDRGHGRARLAEPAHALRQDAEDLDEQVVQDAEAAVVDPEEVQRGHHGGRHPRDEQEPGEQLRKRIFDVRTSAITMPRTSLTATEPNVKTKEFTTARWKKPSLASRM